MVMNCDPAVLHILWSLTADGTALLECEAGCMNGSFNTRPADYRYDLQAVYEVTTAVDPLVRDMVLQHYGSEHVRNQPLIPKKAAA